jgi:pectinesterase
VALRISGDKAAFSDCKFYAHQDTLYDHRGRHYFKNCYVTGTVDFIFGYGRSFYVGAELVALPDFGNPGTITAQKRNETTLDTVTNKLHYHVCECGSHLLGVQIISCFGVQGFSFVRSRITGAGMVYLGRAWGSDSRVVFANTFMDDIVVPEGWGDWGIPARQK